MSFEEFQQSVATATLPTRLTQLPPARLTHLPPPGLKRALLAR